MSVKSVRAAVTAALADKRVSLAEAETITRVAGRTGGVSATERKEIARALSASARWSPGAKAHLAATAAPLPTSSTPTVKALEQIVNARGLDSLSSLKDANEDSFGTGLMAGLEKFASLNGNLDADTLAQGARELVVGKEKLYVVTDLDWDTNKERVGFFNKKGEEVGRATVAKKDDSLTMNWETLGGSAHRGPIGTPSIHGEEPLPASFKKDLEKWVEEKNGDDLGVRVEMKTLPPEVRRQYEFIVRNASDSTGAEKISFQGRTIYALHDFSSVTSSYFFTERGQPLLSTNNG